ncbi:MULTISPECIES: copper amine oxidase N-terminal domain-containing protein [Thermoanaerobacter]|uniref:Copper amine oxidase-like N-terminal domain-containing protein n=1 Tax=Thermoanaerobacter pentosaceus TaxID=694059 RepID=A0ABT9M2G4_9THEO|nr:MULTISPECIES: copper amine oxidase N-terminal domain-containing protein [Thermoanaerobacter]MDP9750130.1 hypothetical protein [Thermoanaerobacter pentosaceus]
MRKKWLIFFGSVILIVSLTIVAFAASTVKLIINGREIKPDVPPQIINGRAMVPIKCVAEALGAELQWDGNNRVIKLISLTERPILFARIAFSRDWQKTTKPIYQELPEYRDIYTKNYYVIVGNSDGSKIFDTLGIDKLECVSSKNIVPEDSLSILTVYSSIIGITAKEQNIIVYVQPQDAGYDFVAVPVADLQAYKDSKYGNKMFTFVFIDTKGKELTRIEKMFP